MKFSFQKKIILLFLIITLIVISAGIGSYRTTQSYDKSNDWVEHTYQVLNALGEMMSSTQDLQIGIRGYVITGDSTYLSPFYDANDTILGKIRKLKKLVVDNPTQLKRIDSIKNLVEERKIASLKIIKARRNGGFDAAQKIVLSGDGMYWMKEIRKLVNTIESEENVLLKIRQKANLEESLAFINSLLLLLGSILLALIVLFFVIRHNTILRNKSEEALGKSLSEILNFKSLFEEAPGLYLILLPDFTIEAVSDEYLKATMTTREGIIGKNMFEVFPDNPDDSIADGEHNLRSSLNMVLKNKEAHRMAVQKYDIQNTDGKFEVRYWSPLNKVVLNENNDVVYLIHSVEDITLRIQHEQELKDSFKEISDYKYALDESAIVAITDQKGIIKYANDKFCEITKYKRDEIIGQDHRIINSGYHTKEFIKDLWTTIANGKLWKGDIKNRAKDGSFYWVDTTLIPFLNDEGKPFQYMAIRFEITKQKEQQELLKIQTEELKAQQEELEEANSGLEEQAQRLTASEEELRVQQEELMQANQELEEKGQLLEEKNQSVNEKNEELEAASFELHQKAEELALSSKYKSEFLANISHELRTPLNSILLLSRLLADNGDKNLSSEQIEFATVIHNSGNGLLELINEILDLSKIESGKMELDIEDVTISAVRKNINDIFKALAKEKGISFSVQTLQGIQENLRSDRIRIEQVLKNFLSNAFKFTEKGKVELIIRTTSEEEATKLRINAANFISFEVKDSGIGIPAEKHAMVFEAFQQADGSTRRKYGGTGLGLSISREIARMLGGDILLESEAEKGSSFTMVIPYDSSAIALDSSSASFNGFNKNKASLEAIKSIVPEVDENVVPFTPDEINDDRLKIGSKDKTILIVEDDTAFAQALLKYVHERGYKAVVAVSGGNAVEYALKYKPIGILLDIQLPVKSGWSIMKELKENPATKYIPVHMMSSLDIKAKDSIALGAVDFMNKAHADKDMMKVLDRIEKVLGKEPKKILLVDDNEVHTMAISRFISDASKTCVIAGTAKEAYEILQREHIDCVVLDMGLPDENGYDVLETIKKNERFEKLPVIIYTGKSLSLQEEKKLKQYTAAIIIKTADSFKRLSSEISLFLHLVEDNKEEKILKKPYIKDKVLSDKHILIVDDDVRNIFALTKLLESQQMKVSSASDGNEALSILKKDNGIDLVLMDMMMPNKDGYEATTDIRSNATLKKMPVIAVTAKAMLGDREKCIKAGANDYITKPVDNDQLLSLLRVWLYK